MKYLTLFFLFAFYLRCEAQTSSVQISDMHVNLDLLSGGAGTTRTKFATPDSVDMRITFKVNNLASCSKAHIYMGTAQDSFDVRKSGALFSHQDTSYYLTCNGTTVKVENNTAVILNKYSRQELLKYKYITLFVEDMNTNTSNRLYFNKK